MKRALAALLGLFLLTSCGSSPSAAPPPNPVNPVAGPVEYIWFSSPSQDTNFPRFFRRSFTLATVPAASTLYIVGPYNFDAWINGSPVAHVAFAGPRVLHDRPVSVTDVSSKLRTGSNTIAFSASAGEEFAMELVPAAVAIDAAPLVVSETTWRASASSAAAWEQPGFDDSAWSTAVSRGGLEDDAHRFQGNFDLRMYRWPGYKGLNALLDHANVAAGAATTISPQAALLDFGREITGRLQVTSASSSAITLHVDLGESVEEASPDTETVTDVDIVVPPNATVYGPLTAYRYARVIVSAPQTLSALCISSDLVFRDVPRRGSFTCSDEVINRIWETSVYTTQLGMQSTFWDAPKRDRNPFSGDLFIAARTTAVAFGGERIVRDTLTDLLRRVTASVNDFTSKDINTIPGYNAYWVLDLADEYEFSGDLNYLSANRDNLVQVLDVMASEVNAQSLFDPSLAPGTTIFADWTLVQFPGQQVPDAVKITTFSFYNGFVAGARLLRALNENALAAAYEQKASAMRSAAIASYLDSATGTFGGLTQTNAMATFAGIADDSTSAKIYSQVLSKPPQLPVSPYFNYFVISAMAQAGHRSEALVFIKQYWGGMLDLGATSFFEVYDPSCAVTDYHACLVALVNRFADQGTNRLFVSLAHGWSSGPAPWLHQQVLGISSLQPGFASIMVRPDLAGLQWARGTQPTAHGSVSVDIQPGGTSVVLDFPADVDAYVSMPTTNQSTMVLVNGAAQNGSLVENNTRTMIHLSQGGHFVLQTM